MSKRPLKPFAKERSEFRATFVRYGTKTGWKGPTKTVLLRNVTHEGKVVCDHLWFNLTKGFELLGKMTEGCEVVFEARAEIYERGYKGHDWMRQMECPMSRDWKLVRPTKIRRAEKNVSEGR